MKHARADATPRLLPEKIEIREVGLRDALQSLRQALPTGLKCDWILLAYAAGLREIEVGAFVSPTEFPQMADTAEVVAFAKTIEGLKVSVVVHDMDGARSAIAAGADVLTFPISASEMHSRANVGRTSAELVEQLRLVRAECDAMRSSCCIEAVISAAFGCALQGDVDPDAQPARACRRQVGRHVLRRQGRLLGPRDTGVGEQCARPLHGVDLLVGAGRRGVPQDEVHGRPLDQRPER